MKKINSKSAPLLFIIHLMVYLVIQARFLDTFHWFAFTFIVWPVFAVLNEIFESKRSIRRGDKVKYKERVYIYKRECGENGFIVLEQENEDSRIIAPFNLVTKYY